MGGPHLYRVRTPFRNRGSDRVRSTGYCQFSNFCLKNATFLAANRVTTCLENLEMSGNLTAVRELSGILLKIGEMSGKNLVGDKLPKTIDCKLHICVHTGI